MAEDRLKEPADADRIYRRHCPRGGDARHSVALSRTGSKIRSGAAARAFTRSARWW